MKEEDLAVCFGVCVNVSNLNTQESKSQQNKNKQTHHRMIVIYRKCKNVTITVMSLKCLQGEKRSSDFISLIA